MNRRGILQKRSTRAKASRELTVMLVVVGAIVIATLLVK